MDDRSDYKVLEEHDVFDEDLGMKLRQMAKFLAPPEPKQPK